MLSENEILEEEYRKQLLDEGIFANIMTKAATALGYSSLTLFAGLGAALVVKSAVSKQGVIRKFFTKLFGKNKGIEFDEIKGRSVAKREIAKSQNFEDKLPVVYSAINKKDWDAAADAFKESKYSNDISAIKAIAIKIVEVVGEPPLFVGVNGNETYFILKKVVGMKYAKAISQSVVVALKRSAKDFDKVELNIE